LSFKLEFETSNNIAKYEALVLGLRAAKDMKIEGLLVFGDAELIVHQVLNIYQKKNPRLKAYRNEVWVLIDNLFSAFKISFFPREANTLADSLAIFSSNFKIPLPLNPKYNVEVKYIHTIPYNIKH
jgi:ribonuclease HI